MTVKEAIQAELEGYSISDSRIDKALALNAVDGTLPFDASQSSPVNLCLIALLPSLLTQPNVSEGGYSVAYDKDAVSLWLQVLCNTEGVINPLLPKVKGVHPW